MLAKKKGSNYLCKCECGTLRDIYSSNLTSGKTKSCGCKKTRAPISEDLTGLRFGSLMVIGRDNAPDSYGTYPYICKCDCGNIISIRNKDILSKFNKCNKCPKPQYDVVDYSGGKFGKLTVIEKVRINNKKFYRCNCDCGKENVMVDQGNLVSGNTKSCGCELKTIEQAAEKCGFINGTAICAIKDRKLNKNNKSGHKGVCWDKKTQSWRVTINIQRKQIGLGFYHDLETAVIARKQGEELYFNPIIEEYEKLKKKDEV